MNTTHMYRGVWYGSEPGQYEVIGKLVEATSEGEARSKFFIMYNGKGPYPLLSVSLVV